MIAEGKAPEARASEPKPILDPKIVAELKEKHGEHLTAVVARKHTLVFRKPTRGEYDIWRDQSHSDKSSQSRFDRELACATVVYPNEDALREVIDDQPALLGVEIAGAITAMAGLADPITVAKL